MAQTVTDSADIAERAVVQSTELVLAGQKFSKSLEIYLPRY